MSERIADPQVVCPFVAFDDDRDFRSPVPDHRHRCFAESPAAPRALAHQAAYCLSGAFAGCPTFVDWARREAAPPKAESPVRSLRGPAGAARGGGATGPAPAPGVSAGRPGEPAALPSESDWAAPPPWAGAAGVAAGAAAAGATGRAASPDDEPEEPDARDEWPPEPTAGGEGPASPGDPDRPAPGAPDEQDARPASPVGDTPAFLAGRTPRAAPPPQAWDDDEPLPAATPSPEDRDAGTPARRPVGEARRVPVGYAPVGYAPVAPAKSERSAGGSHRSDPAAPSWEQPRRSEAYPTIKSHGGGGLPRPALYALVVLLVGLGLFATPFLLRGLGGGGDGASPTPAASASVLPSAATSPTPEPTPEQVVYTVKKNDTLSGIAAKHDVTVEQILAANPNIKNPNSIAVGDQIVIPQPLPSEIVNEEITPAP